MIYTEKDTRRVYQVQLFSDFALVRLITEDGRSVPEKLDLLQFGDRFEEFWGDPALVMPRSE